ncbi:uncharacterized protein LOC133783912 [Humulus lupulus]|uniref:uncharacterized protein LOC133783912 n=1 Tax=Humulus lupulus TaxID=3486 RepID=UPI002B40FF95|nr:uncharacterized protein LOC133783912 [Humulus lupulus]
MIQNKKEFNRNTKSSAFSCAECSFKVHLQCGMLPSTVSYEFHIHPLVLVDWVIDDGCGEYYCDICETERDPRLCVYYCEDCKYVAHVQCLASEIINVLKGDLKDVKFKMVGDDVWKFPEEIKNEGVEITEKGNSIWIFQDLIDNLTECELKCVRDHFDWEKVDKNSEKEKHQSIETTNKLILNDENIDELLHIAQLTKNEFLSFIYDEFESSYEKEKLKIESSVLLQKMVDVEGYSIPLNLVSVMKHILHQYGDIGQNSTSSSSLKSICFFLICRVMKKMYSILVIDISKDLLQEWYSYIRFAKDYAEFDVDFMEASLEAITEDFFYVQVSNLLDDEIPTVINNNMANQRKELHQLVEELQTKMGKYESKLEMRKRFCESTSEKKFMKKNIDNVMKLKWKTVSQIWDTPH